VKGYMKLLNKSQSLSSSLSVSSGFLEEKHQFSCFFNSKMVTKFGMYQPTRCTI